MSQSFSVNGKEYIQSNTLAATFGYTPDYIGKLAREEKILGTQVGRQWFIEPESLKFFLHKAQIEKELRKSELSKQRKQEHAIHQKKPKNKLVPVSSAVHASAQTLAIVLCGVFVGSLCWVSLGADIGLEDITEGSQQLGTALVEGVSPIEALREIQKDPVSFVATAFKGFWFESSLQTDTYTQGKEIFTNLPVDHLQGATSGYNSALITTQSSTTTAQEDVATHFSDEVVTLVDDEGTELITPVFRSQSSSTQFFRLVPFKEDAE